MDIEAKAPCLSILFPDQILEFIEADGEVEGYVVMMSRDFMDKMGLQSDFELMQKLKSQRIVPLNAKGLESLSQYCDMLQKAMQLPNHQYLFETALNLTRAFIYSAGYFFYPLNASIQPNRPERVAREFLQQVRASCHQERRMEFYADKMRLSAKHISHMVKMVTGKTASQWIEEYVVLEARALLSTTDLTISQISDQLHFPDVSTFGKYFKRITNLSPNEFRITSRSVSP